MASKPNNDPQLECHVKDSLTRLEEFTLMMAQHHNGSQFDIISIGDNTPNVHNLQQARRKLG
ncbi:MAG: hypothetical protein GXP17_11645 [Gammaproteobacteria bacterium]|nr:hypothetical protein [Gammaproteobacteria bacterium]